jgi:hypothetical protein
MIAFQCPGCLHRFSVKDQFAGKKTKCPKCGFALTVPASAAPAAGAPARDPLADAPPLPPPPEHFGGRQKQTGLIIAFCTGGALLILAVVLLIIGFGGGGSGKVDPIAKGEPKASPPPELPEVREKRGDQLEVEFLQSVAKGKRFAIIADRSGSMNNPVPFVDPITKAIAVKSSIDCLHDELTRTLRSFTPGTHFYVSFFDDHIIPMPGADTWVEGGKPLDELLRWVRSVRPAGGTEPLPAFQKCFSLDPPPDVIFFMTDGEFNPFVGPEVARMNAGRAKKIVINTIQFENNDPLRGAFGRGGLTNRYARLVELYKLPDAVRDFYEGLSGGAAGFGVGGFRPSKQLEDIARDNGGTFTVFGRVAAGPAGPGKASPILPPVLAVADQLLAFDPVGRYIPGARYRSYLISMKAGVTYQIDMAAAFDTHLFLEESTGRIVAENDDFVGLNSMIHYTAPADGNYRVVATSHVGGATGAFVLTVIDRPLPP